MIFFTSDHHFGHANIIQYCARPFSSVEEMNEMMIRKWNEVVRPEDTVFYPAPPTEIEKIIRPTSN